MSVVTHAKAPARIPPHSFFSQKERKKSGGKLAQGTCYSRAMKKRVQSNKSTRRAKVLEDYRRSRGNACLSFLVVKKTSPVLWSWFPPKFPFRFSIYCYLGG